MKCPKDILISGSQVSKCILNDRHASNQMLLYIILMRVYWMLGESVDPILGIDHIEAEDKHWGQGQGSPKPLPCK